MYKFVSVFIILLQPLGQVVKKLDNFNPGLKD